MNGYAPRDLRPEEVSELIDSFRFDDRPDENEGDERTVRRDSVVVEVGALAPAPASASAGAAETERRPSTRYAFRP